VQVRARERNGRCCEIRTGGRLVVGEGVAGTYRGPCLKGNPHLTSPLCDWGYSCFRGLKMVYCSTVLHNFSKYVVRPMGLLLAVLFVASLVWCSDEACWSGTNDDQCTSLVCALFANHNSPGKNQTNSDSAKCMCVCHTPIISGIDFDTEHHLTVESTTFEFPTFTTSSPTRSIDHPPKS